MTRYCGRDFSRQDLALIRQLLSENPSTTRAGLSRLTCKALHWYKIDGGLKEMSCRVAMLRMQDDGLIKLPAARHRYCPANNVQFTCATAPKPEINKPVHALLCSFELLWADNNLVYGTSIFIDIIILATNPCLELSCDILSSPKTT